MESLPNIIHSKSSQAEFLSLTNEWMNTNDTQIISVDNFFKSLDLASLSSHEAYKVAQLITELSSAKNPSWKDILRLLKSDYFGTLLEGIFEKIVMYIVESPKSEKIKDSVLKLLVNWQRKKLFSDKIISSLSSTISQVVALNSSVLNQYDKDEHIDITSSENDSVDARLFYCCGVLSIILEGLRPPHRIQVTSYELLHLCFPKLNVDETDFITLSLACIFYSSKLWCDYFGSVSLKFILNGYEKCMADLHSYMSNSSLLIGCDRIDESLQRRVIALELELIYSMAFRFELLDIQRHHLLSTKGPFASVVSRLDISANDRDKAGEFFNHHKYGFSPLCICNDKKTVVCAVLVFMIHPDPAVIESWLAVLKLDKQRLDRYSQILRIYCNKWDAYFGGKLGLPGSKNDESSVDKMSIESSCELSILSTVTQSNPFLTVDEISDVDEVPLSVDTIGGVNQDLSISGFTSDQHNVPNLENPYCHLVSDESVEIYNNSFDDQAQNTVIEDRSPSASADNNFSVVESNSATAVVRIDEDITINSTTSNQTIGMMDYRSESALKSVISTTSTQTIGMMDHRSDSALKSVPQLRTSRHVPFVSSRLGSSLNASMHRGDRFRSSSNAFTDRTNRLNPSSDTYRKSGRDIPASSPIKVVNIPQRANFEGRSNHSSLTRQQPYENRNSRNDQVMNSVSRKATESSQTSLDRSVGNVQRPWTHAKILTHLQRSDRGNEKIESYQPQMIHRNYSQSKSQQHSGEAEVIESCTATRQSIFTRIGDTACDINPQSNARNFVKGPEKRSYRPDIDHSGKRMRTN